jgi:hypothetical protein
MSTMEALRMRPLNIKLMTKHLFHPAKIKIHRISQQRTRNS